MADASTSATWRSIDELAALVGAYCWLEQRVFAIAGAWAARPSDRAHGAEDEFESELRVWCASTSRRHGALAARWAERLPVRAGVDADALVAPPPGRLATCLDELAAETDLRRGVAALVDGLFPGLDAVFAAHWRTASPVSEGPVLEVLAEAHREVSAEIRGGRALIGDHEAAQGSPGGDVNFREFFERLLNGSRVFPAVRTS